MSKSTAVLFASMLAGAAMAQVQPRIVQRPGPGALVRLPGTSHPLVRIAKDIGRAPASLPMERILLHLSGSPEQDAALEQLLAEQQDPESPRYHAWLTPEEFGEQFGAALEDVEAIAAWLRARGFQVTEIAPGRRSIEFAGTVEEVETAFHTQVHRYEWQGRQHVANAGEVSIPAALASVVRGVVSLHDFGVRSFHRAAPLTNFSGGARGMSPYDFAAIYNLAPLWAAGHDGSGQTIAVVGETNIRLSDVAGFRAMWGLPANAPNVIVNGKDPGIVSSEETEADLDVEWAGAVAKGAKVYFVTSGSTSASDGVTLSAQYIVQHNTAPVVSLSYGLCEAQLGSGNAFFKSLWQQAAAQGMAVFVAGGDSGSAGCDAAGGGPATLGFGVNGLASTPYNIAVGGTEFNDTASPANYWSPVNNAQMASALGYIPEVAWNESAGAGGSGLYAGGGGASTQSSRPAWQMAAGMPAGSMRLIPDVSLSAGSHDGYVVEQEGALYLVGGTSAGTPAFAGLMAILNQYTHTANGNPASQLYGLYASLPAAFHDITAGSNAVPCQAGSLNCSAGKMAGYSAGAGYDLATGLGSVDATALVTNWAGTSAGPLVVSLSPNSLTGSAAGQLVTINGSGFAAGSGLAVQVGSVSYSGAAVTYVSSTRLTVSVTVGTGAQSLPVQVTNPNGKTSNSVILTVTAPAAAPVLASLGPNPMPGSSAARTLTINGSGFLQRSGLKVTVGSSVYLDSQVNFVSSTQLSVSFTPGLGAHSFPVQVTNPGGLASNTVNLGVTAAPGPPAVFGLSPNPMAGSTSPQLLTVTGVGFVSGSGLKVTVGGAVYQGAQITSVTTNQFTVSVVPGTAAQTLPVVVTNPDGQSASPLSLLVTAASTGPAISSLSPNPMAGSAAAQTLTVNGSGFVAGSGAKVTVGGTVYQGAQILSVTATQIRVSVAVGTAAQSLSVTVTNPGGAVSKSAALNVTAAVPSPAILSLNPNPMTASNAVQTLTINGSGFQPGLRLTIGGTLVTANQLALLTSTQLQLKVITGLTAYTYPVQVINANGGMSNIVNLQVSAATTAKVASAAEGLR